MAAPLDIRTALDLVGSFGRYHVIHYLAIAVTYSLPTSWQLIGIVFIGHNNDHHCKVQQNVSLYDALPVEVGPDGRQRYSQCHMYSERGNNASDQLPCTDGWEYSPGPFDPEDGTITAEWDLVCDRNGYVELTVILFNLGLGIGYLVLCPFGDRLGRRIVFFLSHILTTVVGVAMAFSPNFVAFCVFRLLSGFAVAGVYAEGNILLAELLPTRLRSFASLSALFDSLGNMSVALWAYFFRNWRHLQLSFSLAGLVALVYYWWCPESLVWLASTNRNKLVVKQLQKIGRANKTPATVGQLEKELKIVVLEITVEPERPIAEGGTAKDDEHSITESLKDTTGGETNQVPKTTYNSDSIHPATLTSRDISSNTVGDVDKRGLDRESVEHPVGPKSEFQNLKHFMSIPAARRYYIIMMFSTFVSYTSYISLILMSGYLHGDIYVNVAITNLMEVPGVILGVLMMLRFGRRVPCITMELCLVMLLALASGLSIIENAKAAVTVFMVLARVTWGGTWAIKLIYFQEIVPTSIRSTSFGIGIFVSSIGGVIAPYVSIYLLEIRTWLPCAILGVLHLLSGSLLLLVPETLGRELPSTPEEVAAWPTSLTPEEKRLSDVEWRRIWRTKGHLEEETNRDSPREQIGGRSSTEQTDAHDIGQLNPGFEIDEGTGQDGETINNLAVEDTRL